MDLDDLKSLLLLAKHQSVKKAADASGTSRTSLRRRLDALEHRLGAQLFVRDDRGVRPTSAGEVVLARAAPLIEAAEELMRSVAVHVAEPAGRLRVIVPLGLPNGSQVQILLHQRLAHPKLTLESVEVPDPLALCDERFDLMFHFGAPPARGAWFSRVLLRPRTKLFASPSYLESAGVPKSIHDLRDHALLHWQLPGAGADAWPLRAGGHVAIDPWFRSPNMNLLRELAASGGGILLSPDGLAAADPLSGPLVPFLEDEVGGQVEYRVLSPIPSDADPRTRETLRAIHATLADLPET